MFRFTIRDVLWLTVVVALAVAWYVDRARVLDYNRSLLVQQAQYQAEMAKARIEALRARELELKAILPAGTVP